MQDLAFYLPDVCWNNGTTKHPSCDKKGAGYNIEMEKDEFIQEVVSIIRRYLPADKFKLMWFGS